MKPYLFNEANQVPQPTRPDSQAQGRRFWAALLSRAVILGAVILLLISMWPECLAADCIEPAALWRLDESGASPEYQNSINPGSHSGACRQQDSIAVCPQPEPGRYGTGQRFNVSGQPSGIDIPDPSIFNWNRSDSFSISFWMKRDNAPFDRNEVIIGRDSDESGNDMHWWFGIEGTGVAMVVLLDRTRQPVGGTTYLQGDRRLTDNRWHYLVFTRDGARSESSLYVDGVLEDTVVFTYDTDEAFSADATPVNIGWISLPELYFYKGVVDEIALYSVALPSWFIRDRYHADERYVGDRPDPCD